MRHLRRYLGILIVLLLAAGVGYYVMSQPAQQQKRAGKGKNFAETGPVPVLLVQAKLSDVPVYIDGVGTTKALNMVTVRPQVDGKLIKVSFKEGQDVKRGDVLAEIDPTTYQAMLDQAVAKKAQDEATLANARLDLDRYVRLAQTNSGNKQQADTQRALVSQLEAQVKLDQGAIDNARAILSYTRIVAPIDGKTGIRQVDEGNIVHASDATGIVVLTQVKPISVVFTIPQQQLSQINKAFAAGALTVETLNSVDRSVVDRGSLQVVDNQVDQTTGTVKLKADFPNADLQLWPGQFVNVRLQVDTLKQVLVVPTAAVQRGPNGTFVYVWQEGDTVAVKQVTVVQQDDAQAVIRSGLDAADKVVTTGFARLANGAAVTVSTADAADTPAGDQPGRRKRGEGKNPDGKNPDGTPREGRKKRSDQESNATK